MISKIRKNRFQDRKNEIGCFLLVQPISIHYNRKTPKTEKIKSVAIMNFQRFATDNNRFRLLKILIATEKTEIGFDISLHDFFSPKMHLKIDYGFLAYFKY